VASKDEIIGKQAAAGKVGYGIVRKALVDNGIELSLPSDIETSKF
jgi:hypothetical protein